MGLSVFILLVHLLLGFRKEFFAVLLQFVEFVKLRLAVFKFCAHTRFRLFNLSLGGFKSAFKSHKKLRPSCGGNGLARLGNFLLHTADELVVLLRIGVKFIGALKSNVSLAVIIDFIGKCVICNIYKVAQFTASGSCNTPFIGNPIRRLDYAHNGKCIAFKGICNLLAVAHNLNCAADFELLRCSKVAAGDNALVVRFRITSFHKF